MATGDLVRRPEDHSKGLREDVWGYFVPRGERDGRRPYMSMPYSYNFRKTEGNRTRSCFTKEVVVTYL